jgi:hypothetical protein
MSESASRSNNDHQQKPPMVVGQNRVLLFRELSAEIQARPLAKFLERFARVLKLTIPAPLDDGEALG